MKWNAELMKHFIWKNSFSSVEDGIRDVETLIAQPQHEMIWRNLIFNAQDRLISIPSNHFFNYEYFPFSFGWSSEKWQSRLNIA